MIGQLIFAITWPPLFATLWRFVGRGTPPRQRVASAWFSGAIGCLISGILYGAWLPTVISVAQIAIALLIWWWKRKRPDRAARALGAKSRARIDDLVRAMRETATPSPRPAWGGAS